MRKKIMIGFAAVLFSIFMLASNAFAVDTFYIHMTDADESTAVETTFGWNELPWLRIHIPDSGWSVVGSFWKTPGSEFFFSGTSSTDLDRWVSGNDLEDQTTTSVAWLDIREIGQWNINAVYLNAPTGETGSDYTNFTVTPEPVSSVLFLIGGVSLASFGYRRRKKNS